MNMQLMHLVEVNEHEQTITVEVFYDLIWTNEYAMWNSTQWYNIKSMKVSKVGWKVQLIRPTLNFVFSYAFISYSCSVSCSCSYFWFYSNWFQDVVWIPDVILVNTVRTPPSFHEGTEWVTVYEDGHSLWEPKVTLVASFKASPKYFPFERQNFNFDFQVNWIVVRVFSVKNWKFSKSPTRFKFSLPSSI